MADAVTYCVYPQLGHMGRLGNAMWEIASTIGLARKHGMDPLFPPDWAYRSVFSVPDEMFGNAEGVWSGSLATHLDDTAKNYLQDYSLWSDVRDEVLAYFEPSDFARRAVAERGVEFLTLPDPILSVHVRRGDNVQANDMRTPNKHLYHPLRPLSYYLSAIEHFRPEVASIAVFGEDADVEPGAHPGRLVRGWRHRLR